MLSREYESSCYGMPGESCSISFEKSKKAKPIEIYVFIDPICPKCWGLEPILKKLTVEYGQYFKIRFLIGARLGGSERASGKKTRTDHWQKTRSLGGMPCDNTVFENDSPSFFKAALAVKAAELQGRGAGGRYMRILRERLFIESRDINEFSVLLECAERAKPDLDEFKKDMNSNSPIKALQCDRRIMGEMDITECPSMVFINIHDDKEGLKVTGAYPYSVYVQILTETLGETPKQSEPPALIDFIKKYRFFATKEIAVVYNMDEQETLRELKKLKLKQLVEPVAARFGTFWRYIGE